MDTMAEAIRFSEPQKYPLAGGHVPLTT
ncbi:MAG: hypothetical protein QOH20_3360, partial [Mycobacterium sp.]|nr:hypothetical protein [Mycobacterium sp.]